MKYYLEYKNKEEFDVLNKYYNETWGYAKPGLNSSNPNHGFIIKDATLTWKPSYEKIPTDAKKITFEEWKEMTNPKLEWKEGAYVKYLGTKEGKNSGNDWEQYFNTPGLKAGDIGIIIKIEPNLHFFIKDNIRKITNGYFLKEDLQLITKEEYEAGLRCPTGTYEFNEGDLVVVTKFNGLTNYDNGYFKSGEIIELGGKYWNSYTRESIDNFENLPFISKNNINGDCYSYQTKTTFRHCTPEEIAYYNKVGLRANINDMKKEEPKLDLPFKIGDEVTILSEPDYWADEAGGKMGLYEVQYPYTFIVKNILYCKAVNKVDDYIAIFDGIYGWCYDPDIFIKGKPTIVKEESDWKIVVHTDDKCDNRPHVIEYLLSLNKDATNNFNLKACDRNHYYCLDYELNVRVYPKVLDNYKVIEEKDLPNYPKKSFEVSHDSPSDLKWVVKSSINVLKLLDKLTGFKDYYENYGFGYKYINYPFCNGSHVCYTVPSGYVEISEQEALDRLNAVINDTPLISTNPVIPSEAFNKIKEQPSKIITIKKQSLAEQLCQIMEKEPVNIPVISLFPTKRKSIINNLKF